MASQFDLTNLETLKEYLRINTATDDALLTRMITAASKFMLQDMNRSLGMFAQDITERFDGTGSAIYQPRNYPLISVSALSVGPVSISPSADGIVSGYMVDTQRDRIVLIGYRFDLGLMNCVATYRFGYQTTPEDVEQACCELCGVKYKRIKSLNLVSEQLPQGGGTVTFLTKDVPDDVRNVIEQYTVRF